MIAPSKSDLSQLAVSVGLTIVLWDWRRPVKGLYVYCPARHVRCLLVNRLLGWAEYQCVVAEGLSLCATNKHVEVLT